MQLIEMLTEKQIVADLRAVNRWEAIQELTDRLVATGKIRPEHRDGIIAAVRKREASMSTGIGCGIAIPHATTDLVSESMAAVGRSRNRVDFDALDGQPANIVMLLLVPQGRLQAHLHMLASMARLLKKAELRRAIEAAFDANAHRRRADHPRSRLPRDGGTPRRRVKRRRRIPRVAAPPLELEIHELSEQSH